MHRVSTDLRRRLSIFIPRFCVDHMSEIVPNVLILKPFRNSQMPWMVLRVKRGEELTVRLSKFAIFFLFSLNEIKLSNGFLELSLVKQ